MVMWTGGVSVGFWVGGLVGFRGLVWGVFLLVIRFGLCVVVGLTGLLCGFGGVSGSFLLGDLGLGFWVLMVVFLVDCAIVGFRG